MAMFSLLLRAGLIFVAGGIIAVVLRITMETPLAELESLSPEESTNHMWLEATVEWFPLFVLGSLALMLIAGAALRRGGRR